MRCDLKARQVLAPADFQKSLYVVGFMTRMHLFSLRGMVRCSPAFGIFTTPHAGYPFCTTLAGTIFLLSLPGGSQLHTGLRLSRLG